MQCKYRYSDSSLWFRGGGVHSTALRYFNLQIESSNISLENNLILLIITHVSLLIYSLWFLVLFCTTKVIKVLFLKFSYSVMYHYENLNFRKQSASISREATLYFLSSLSEIRKTLLYSLQCGLYSADSKLVSITHIQPED